MNNSFNDRLDRQLVLVTYVVFFLFRFRLDHSGNVLNVGILLIQHKAVTKYTKNTDTLINLTGLPAKQIILFISSSQCYVTKCYPKHVGII